MNLPVSLSITILLLAGNAFFVGAEFALVAARRVRLERDAARGSRAARAAVAGIDELSLMLAGAQLGITMCSLGLGAVTEPAFEHILDPPLEAVGAPGPVRHSIAFVVALAIVTFLHMVVGEMAPKSWAITDPERSARTLAVPFLAFTRLARPLITMLNGVTTALLRLVHVRPPTEADSHADPRRLSHLITESRRLGLIGQAEHALLGRAIATYEATIAHLIVPADDVAAVPADADAERIRRTSAEHGHTRILVRADGRGIAGMLHVREALTGRTASGRAADMMYPVPTLPPGCGVLDALTTMRNARAQLAVVASSDDPFIGLVSLDDLLGDLLTANPH
ncbi:CNNM domain-containing protein [Actinoallomurus acaciae]|uniref:CNNM domain-containing protein n=1 Tax=Actinoallomurus acaciae TaxID=502577 RepID=A0ABV5YH27_9ACTN